MLQDSEKVEGTREKTGRKSCKTGRPSKSASVGAYRHRQCKTAAFGRASSTQKRIFTILSQ
ncbi:hypothetical protein EZS27_022466 [termite gut metagenome]|uniref:Uncharacterized protein n=1 Tax=termite gut metagenome TaxID=433724 RepID=A0A5J4R4R7_9ZZZZ